jgi:N-hydroxyarylamine O-acetyltransferase
MTDENFNLDSYLERIKYSGGTDISEKTLRELHIAHTLNIPFENLDVYYGKPVLLDKASLFNKIVTNRRGGYCFEMNGLFSLVLQKLGFNVTNLLARGTMDGINFTTKTHQVILVENNGKRWLADVGFGNDGIIAPLLLKENLDQKQFAHTYRLIKNPKFGYVLQKKILNKYMSLYAFTLMECYPEDFIMSNHFTSTFPESFFVKMRMCTMPTKEGRITLTDTQFKTMTNGDITEKAIENDDEFSTFLKKYFSLDLDLVKDHIVFVPKK